MLAKFALVCGLLVGIAKPVPAMAVECAGDRTYGAAWAEGCTSIGGSLMITGGRMVTLAGLAGLERVGGSLVITNNKALGNLDGLSGLVSIGSNADRSSQGLIINGNGALRDIDGLSRLVEVTGSIQIVANGALENLDGLPGLSSTGASGDRSGASLVIADNGSLRDIDGLSGVSRSEGSIRVVNNDALDHVDGLSRLTSIGTSGDGSGESLVIADNGSLRNIDGLTGLSETQGGIRIVNNGALGNLAGLSRVTWIGASGGGSGESLVIADNGALRDLDGLSALRGLGGGLRLVNNDALDHLDGLSGLTSVGSNSEPASESVVIADNGSLRDINGLSGLTSLGGGLRIANNDALDNLDGLAGLRSAGSSANQTGESLAIEDNGALRDLDGLSGLTGTGGSIRVANNDALENLDGLSGLRSIGSSGDGSDESLVIADNGSLRDIDGLYGLGAIPGAVRIVSNDDLCESQVADLFESVVVGGALTISENSGSCVSVCGDGIVDAGEACDDGNTHNGDCCSSTCDIEAAGTVCRPMADICDQEEVCDGIEGFCPADERIADLDADGVCDDIDICPEVADREQSDADGDGLGDACDPCTGGVIAENAVLQATNFVTPEADDKLSFKADLVFPEPVALSPQINGFRLLVEGAEAGGDVLLDLAVPAGLYDPLTRSGWIPAANGKKFQYITKEILGGMEPKVILKWNPKEANEVVVVVKGKTGNFAQPAITLPLKATLSLEPTDPMSTLCAEAEYPGPRPQPFCRMSANGVAVLCK
jgi:cysteine-rich repeat protein